MAFVVVVVALITSLSLTQSYGKIALRSQKHFSLSLISVKPMIQLIGISCGANCLVLVLVVIF